MCVSGLYGAVFCLALKRSTLLDRMRKLGIDPAPNKVEVLE